MSIYDAGTARAANFAVRDRTDRLAPNCGSSITNYLDANPGDSQAQNLDLVHAWNQGSAVATWDLAINAASPRIDRNAPYVRSVQSGADKGEIRACWRKGNSPDAIECGKQTGVGGNYSTATLANGGNRQEHVALDLDGDDRVAIHRSRESNRWVIRARFVDGGDPYVKLFESASTSISEGADYPDFRVASLRHVHIETDGNRMFMVYMEDDDDSNVWRVRYQTKCWSDASWSGAVTPHEPTVAGWSESTFLGRTATAADRGSNVFNAVFVDMNAVFSGFPSDGEVWWVTRTYTDCP